MQKSTIEWTNLSWNPTRGCTRVSEGCQNCYAEAIAARFKGVKGSPYELGFVPRLVPERLADPFRVAGRAAVFVNSMSDLFHPAFPANYIRAEFEVMKRADWLVFQILTKRHERMHELMNGLLAEYSDLPNVWLGVSVENRDRGLPRIDALRDTPARVRFLSVEPLLEDLGPFDLAGIDWVITGGESGRGRRRMHADWARSVRDLCLIQGVRHFFKQFGHIVDNPDPADPTAKENGGTAKGGRRLDGRLWNQTPPFPKVDVPSIAERRRRRVSYEDWVSDYVKPLGVTLGSDR